MVIDQSLSRTHWDCAREWLRHASFSDLFPVANPSPPWPWWRGRRRTWACVCGLQNDLIPQNGTSLLKLNCSQVEFGGRLCNQATHPRVLDNSRERNPFSVPHKAGANGLAEVVPINQCQRGPEIRSSSPDLSPSRRWRDADPSTWLVYQWDTLNLTDTGGRWLLPLDGLGNVRSATPRSKKEGRAGLGWWRKKMGSNLPPTHSQAFFFVSCSEPSNFSSAMRRLWSVQCSLWRRRGRAKICMANITLRRPCLHYSMVSVVGTSWRRELQKTTTTATTLQFIIICITSNGSALSCPHQQRIWTTLQEPRNTLERRTSTVLVTEHHIIVSGMWGAATSG